MNGDPVLLSGAMRMAPVVEFYSHGFETLVGYDYVFIVSVTFLVVHYTCEQEQELNNRNNQADVHNALIYIGA